MGNGLVLEVDGGGYWQLDIRDNRAAERLRSCHVMVRGSRTGFELIDVTSLSVSDDWIAATSDLNEPS